MKREERMEQILNCTLELIGQKSLDSIRTAEIAKAANISEGAMYKYFSSKDEILDQIMLRYVDKQHPLQPVEEITTVDDFRNFLDNYLSSMIDIKPSRISYLRLLLQISIAQQDLAFSKYEQVRNGFWAIMEDRIEYGKKHWGFNKEFDTPIQVRLFHLALLMFIIEQEVFGAKRIDPYDLNKVKGVVIDNLFCLLT